MIRNAQGYRATAVAAGALALVALWGSLVTAHTARRFVVRLSTVPITAAMQGKISGRRVQFVEGSGGTAGDRRFFEMPGSNGNVGKLAAYDLSTGETRWETRLGTSVQGFPVSFRVDGKQYIAVTTGLGGGSPRVVPRTIAPDVRHPQTGNPLYVFALDN